MGSSPTITKNLAAMAVFVQQPQRYNRSIIPWPATVSSAIFLQFSWWNPSQNQHFSRGWEHSERAPAPSGESRRSAAIHFLQMPTPGCSQPEIDCCSHTIRILKLLNSLTASSFEPSNDNSLCNLSSRPIPIGLHTLHRKNHHKCTKC